MKYEYENFSSSPNLSDIKTDIETSDMENKNVSFLRWDQEDSIVKIHFAVELSTGDLTKLDNIMSVY
jgi:hypothetical protein